MEIKQANENEPSLRVSTQYNCYHPSEEANIMISIEATHKPCSASSSSSSSSPHPMEVVFCLDVSGSMAPSMNLLNHTLGMMLQLIPHTGYKISIVTFNDKVRQYSVMSPFTPEKQQLLIEYHRQYPLTSQGGTNLAAGLVQSLEQFSGNADVRKFLVLLSDGDPTVGPLLPGDVLSHFFANDKHRGVSVFSVALTANACMEVLTGLSKETQGRLYYLQTSDDIPKTLGDILGSLATLSFSSVILECGGVNYPIGSLYESEVRSVLLKKPVGIPVILSLHWTDITGYPKITRHQFTVSSTLDEEELKNRVCDSNVEIQIAKDHMATLVTYCAATGNVGELILFRERLQNSGVNHMPAMIALIQELQHLIDLGSQQGQGLQRAFTSQCVATSAGLSQPAAEDYSQLPLLRRSLSSRMETGSKNSQCEGH
jgi:uncharacterized protein YegL